MSDEKKVVDLAVEPTPQIDRTPIATETPAVETPAVEQQPTVETPVAQEQAPVLPVQPVADVDEYGVPWKNRAMEWKRKSEEAFEKLPQMIEDKLKTVTQPQTPQYTVEQLKAYKYQQMQLLGTDAEAPARIAWAEAEQEKMQAVNTRKIFEEVIGQKDKQKEFDSIRQKSFEIVKEKRPEALDAKHPMFNLVKGYMQNTDLAARPDGLVIAAKLAYADYMESQAPVLQKKVDQAKADVKQAQKASMTEGGGRRAVVTQAPQIAAIEQAKKTGSLKDAEAAMGAILRSRGILEQ